MEFNLVPLYYRKIYHAHKLVRYIVSSIIVLISVALPLTGIANDWVSYIIFCIPWLHEIAYSFVLGLLYDRVTQSTVIFQSKSIQISDKKGRLWREIPYDRITKSSIEDVTGFFYGSERHKAVSKYICFYLNQEKIFPALAPYKKLFCGNDFFMMAHSKEAWETFIKMYSSYIDPREKM